MQFSEKCNGSELCEEKRYVLFMKMCFLAILFVLNREKASQVIINCRWFRGIVSSVYFEAENQIPNMKA